MLLINGELWEENRAEEAVRRLRGQIPETLSRGPLEKEIVIAAADRLAREAESGALLAEIVSFLSAGAMGMSGGKRELPGGLTVGQAARMFRRETLERKWELELGHLPSGNGNGKWFERRPLGVLLHIAAGNVDALPAYSVLEGLLAGNINLLKLPSADGGLSLFLLKKITEYEPRLAGYLAVFDTPSSDRERMQELMGLANGIAVWGSEEAVKAVRSQAPANTRLIEWGHKLSFAYLQNAEVPERMLEGLARHILETRQLLCSSCQVIYLDTGSWEELTEFGRRFAAVLGREEKAYPLEPFIRGKIQVEQRTRYLEGYEETHPTFRNRRSSVTCCADSELEVSLQFGNVLVKPLPRDRIVETLWPKRGYLQTAGLYPEDGEAADLLAAAGVTRLCGLNRMSGLDLLESHDGMFPLLQYSRIVER